MGKVVEKGKMEKKRWDFHNFAMTMLMGKLGPEIGGAFRFFWGWRMVRENGAGGRG